VFVSYLKDIGFTKTNLYMWSMKMHMTMALL